MDTERSKTQFNDPGRVDRIGSFLAATFQAAIEDDPEEDAIWRKYIK